MPYLERERVLIIIWKQLLYLFLIKHVRERAVESSPLKAHISKTMIIHKIVFHIRMDFLKLPYIIKLGYSLQKKHFEISVNCTLVCMYETTTCRSRNAFLTNRIISAPSTANKCTRYSCVQHRVNVSDMNVTMSLCHNVTFRNKQLAPQLESFKRTLSKQYSDKNNIRSSE